MPWCWRRSARDHLRRRGAERCRVPGSGAAGSCRNDAGDPSLGSHGDGAGHAARLDTWLGARAHGRTVPRRLALRQARVCRRLVGCAWHAVGQTLLFGRRRRCHCTIAPGRTACRRLCCRHRNPCRGEAAGSWDVRSSRHQENGRIPLVDSKLPVVHSANGPGEACFPGIGSGFPQLLNRCSDRPAGFANGIRPFS